MYKIGKLIFIVLMVMILYGYCIFKEKQLNNKFNISHNMLYITMLDTLNTDKDKGRKIIEIMLTTALKSDIENIGKNNNLDTNTIHFICESWTQNTVSLIEDKTKEYNLSKINSDFKKGTNIIMDICNKETKSIE